MTNESKEAFERIQKMLEAKEDLIDNTAGEIVNLSLSTQQRLDIYDEILQLLDSGEDNKRIAMRVVGLLNDHINDIMHKAKERKRGKSPIFRRVDE